MRSKSTALWIGRWFSPWDNIAVMDVRRGDKIRFLIQRQDGRVRAQQIDGDLVVEAETLSDLRRVLPTVIRARFGVERPSALMVGAKVASPPVADARTEVQAGSTYVMTVRPPEQYAGQVGARAVVVSAAEHVAVLFESGLRESFPRRRFDAYFAPVLPLAEARLGPRPAPLRLVTADERAAEPAS